MPEISRFFGIVIRMYYNDHNPPHFHARYGSSEAIIGINPLVVLEGDLPARATALAMEWAALHQQELLENWTRLRRAEGPHAIDPLV